jgi:plastocyanin
MPHPYETRHLWPAYTTLLALILIGAGVFYYLDLTPKLAPTPQQAPQARTDIPAGFPQTAPTPTKADLVTAQHGFQYLISYTSGGFKPAALAIKKGETIRFTNVSPVLLQVSVEAAQSSALNQGEYWEHTFSTAGTFTASDTAGHTISIAVN